MTKILFQRFIDRDGNEIGHRASERTCGHWARERYLNRFYNLQYFEREGDKIVAVFRAEHRDRMSTAYPQKVDLH